MDLPDGFVKERPKSASGRPLTGRFTCEDIQWTGSGGDLLGTFAITVRELLDLAESNLLWTDQDVQRGVKPERPQAERLLSLANGYPDPENYIFVNDNADEIAEKLLFGKKLYLSPLIWSLRPGEFEGFRDDENERFIIYSGKIFLPDSHHRHQGILKAARAYREQPKDYPDFSLDKQFKVDVYFLSKMEEGNFFYDKNQLTRQTAKSKAFDLTTGDALSLLAKQIASNSKALDGNVNRVTDRLTSRNPQVVTLSTLREMAKSIVPQSEVSEHEIEGTAALVATFFDKLAERRSILGRVPIERRVESRRHSLADAAVTMHGYAALARDFMDDLPKLGSSEANRIWDLKLDRLAEGREFTSGDWSGDLFAKENPLWTRLGILKPSNRLGYSQVNNGATRAAMGRALRAVVSSASTNLDASLANDGEI